MEPNEIKVGSLYTTEYESSAYYINNSVINFAHHETYDIYPGDVFMILTVNEIIETQTVDIEILYNNQKMWFTFHINEFIIDDVRRAGSYDIPFTTLDELEPGSFSTP